jgi:hypothetical protein
MLSVRCLSSYLFSKQVTGTDSASSALSRSVSHIIYSSVFSPFDGKPGGALEIEFPYGTAVDTVHPPDSCGVAGGN